MIDRKGGLKDVGGLQDVSLQGEQDALVACRVSRSGICRSYDKFQRNRWAARIRRKMRRFHYFVYFKS